MAPQHGRNVLMPHSTHLVLVVLLLLGARRSSVVVSADGLLDQSLMVDPLSYFSFQPLLPTGVTKVVVCAILSGMVHIKDALLLRVAHVEVAAGFLSCYQ